MEVAFTNRHGDIVWEADLDVLPRVKEFVSIGEKSYYVADVEWVFPDNTESSPHVNVRLK
jgi:hypothetical protein